MKKIILFTLGAILITVLAAALFITFRQARAAAQAESKWESTQAELNH